MESTTTMARPGTKPIAYLIRRHPNGTNESNIVPGKMYKTYRAAQSALRRMNHSKRFWTFTLVPVFEEEKDER